MSSGEPSLQVDGWMMYAECLPCCLDGVGVRLEGAGRRREEPASEVRCEGTGLILLSGRMWLSFLAERR